MGADVFGNVQVTRRRQVTTGATDAYDQPITTDEDTPLTPLAGFDPGGSREPVEIGRQPTVTTPKLYWQGTDTIDLTDQDQVLVLGKVYDVIGYPAVWNDPFGSTVGGIVVELKRAGG
jgi:hypothetical protein